MDDRTLELQRKLDLWQELSTESSEAALALLGAAESTLEHAETPGEELLWRRYLDQTGERRFLRSLAEQTHRERWSKTAFAAIQRGDYRLQQLMERNVVRCPNTTYLQERAAGLTVRWSYAQINRYLKAVAAVFFKAVEQPRVAILAANDVRTAACDLACLLHGILVSPLNVHADVETLTWIIDRLEINLVVADTSARVRVLREVAQKTKTRFRVVTVRPCSDAPEDAILLPEARVRISPSEAEQVLAQRPARSMHEVATVLFTSGSTGQPKGVSFSHYHLVSKRFARHAALPDVGLDELLFAYLPLYHTFGRYLELLGMLYWGGTYVFAGNPSAETLLKGLESEHPSGLISIPLRWAQIYERCIERLEGNVDPRAQKAVLREVTGGRLRWGLSAAGYLDPKIFRFFQEHGIALCSGFGMTEATGGITMSPPGDYRENTVGIPLPGMELRFGEMDELHIKGQYLARYLDDAGPGDTIDPDEDYWLATGDLFAQLGDGHVQIVDRIKDIYKNNKGQTIAPRRVEQKFAAVPGLKRAFLVGDGRSHNVLLIVPNRDDSVFSAFKHDEDVDNYFGRLIAEANRDLAPYERVVNFALLDRDFTLDHGELTPKGSYRRKVIEKNFEALIEKLYRRRYVELCCGDIPVRIPRWLYRDLGLLETDVIADDEGLINQRNSRRLSIGHSQTEGWYRLGSLEYQLPDETIDLGTLARQPLLWVGNPMLAAFCPCKGGWDAKMQKLSRCGRPLLEPPPPNDPPNLSAVRDPRLLEVHSLVAQAYFDPEPMAIEAIESLAAIMAASDERLAQLIRCRLMGLAAHPKEELRCTAYRALLLDEPMPDYNEAFPAFIASGLPFLNEKSIDYIATRNLKTRRLEALRQRLHSYRTTFDWNSAGGAREQFERVFQLLVNFVKAHPEYFAPIRAELATWVLFDRDPALAARASEHLQSLISWFDVLIEPDDLAGQQQPWRERLVFEASIAPKERVRILKALCDPAFFRKSMLLIHDVKAFSLEHVKSAWITHVLTSARFSRYRLSINTEQHYEMQLVLRNGPPDSEELQTDFWAMSMAAYPFGTATVPRFGYWRRDLRSMTLYYQPDLTVWDKIRQYASAVQPDEEQPWRKLFIRGIATLFRAWRSSGRRIVPGCVSPTNVQVPELDFRESALLLSLTDCSTYRDPRDLIVPIVHNFFERIEAHYPWITPLIDRCWVFDAAIEGLGMQPGLELVRRILEDASAKPLENWASCAEDAERYLIARQSEPFVPLALSNAKEKYLRWLREHSLASVKAREDIVAQLFNAYRIDRFGEWARLWLYRHTFFASLPAKTRSLFDALLQQMFLHPELAATQHVQLSDLQAKIDDPETREVLSRMIFPETQNPAAVEVQRVGEREHVVVRSELLDKVGTRYTVRAPLDPAEIGQLYRLFHKEKYPQQVRAQDQYLVIIDRHWQLMGGLCYQLDSESQMAYVDAMVISSPVQRRGIGGALLHDFCTRMRELGVQIVKANLLLRGVCARQGFAQDTRWGGMVRFLGRPADNHKPALTPIDTLDGQPR
jgi:long-chain acyl-CoA synthetase